jgi:four helix bundle protein
MEKVKSKYQFETWQKARALADSVIQFSDTLPMENLNDLKHRLRFTAESLSPAIEEGLLQDRRIDRLRNWIRANTFLEEVRDYLQLIEMLRYGETRDLVSKLNEIEDLIKRDYSFFKNSQ